METKAPEDRRAVWMRGLFMLFFIIAFGVGQVLLALLAVVQFLWLVFAQEPNPFLVRFGNSLSSWFSDTARFLSCASDEKPFPWIEWPDANRESDAPPHQSKDW